MKTAIHPWKLSLDQKRKLQEAKKAAIKRRALIYARSDEGRFFNKLAVLKYQAKKRKILTPTINGN